MNMGGDAVDQTMKVMLEGTEIALRLTGAGAKNLAVLLYTVLNDQHKTKGKIGLTKMLKSGKPIEVFSIRNDELVRFAREAREYGILYHAVHDSSAGPDGYTDILVYKEDAPRMNNMIERIGFGTVKDVSIENPMAARQKENPRSGSSSGVHKGNADRSSVHAELKELKNAQASRSKTPEKNRETR